MVRSLAAKELAITELGERLCALNIVSGRRGLGEERRLSPEEHIGGRMGR